VGQVAIKWGVRGAPWSILKGPVLRCHLQGTSSVVAVKDKRTVGIRAVASKALLKIQLFENFRKCCRARLFEANDKNLFVGIILSQVKRDK
jgi:hypothetical protein